MNSARVTGALAAVGAAVTLGVATVLAFFSGGFFDQPRLWAAVVVWSLVVVLALAGARPLPRQTPARLAVASLAALAVLTALSTLWAPLAGPVQDDYQRLALYLGTLVLGVVCLQPPAAARAVEPALALGAAGVMAYGLSERLLPGLFDLSAGFAAQGRLEQPLTYWNAMGALGACGLVLCARLAGAPDRPPAIRYGAAALIPLLGLGTYLTFSRGALLALGAGALVLALLGRTRVQTGAVLVALAAAVAAALASELPGLGTLGAASGNSGSDGAVMLVILGILAAGSAAGVRRLHLEGSPGRRARWSPPRRALLAVPVAALLAGSLLLVTGGDEERGADAAGAQRLRSVESNRYDYWEVAVGVFADQPVAGHGGASFRVDWLRERDIDERVSDAHSLYLETAAELGLAGLACLGLLVASVGMGARRALRADATRAVGPAAVLTALAVHAGIDWDWEMPAVALVAMACAAALLAISEVRRA